MRDNFPLRGRVVGTSIVSIPVRELGFLMPAQAAEAAWLNTFQSLLGSWGF